MAPRPQNSNSASIDLRLANDNDYNICAHHRFAASEYDGADRRLQRVRVLDDALGHVLLADVDHRAELGVESAACMDRPMVQSPGADVAGVSPVLAQTWLG